MFTSKTSNTARFCLTGLDDGSTDEVLTLALPASLAPMERSKLTRMGASVILACLLKKGSEGKKTCLRHTGRLAY